MLENPRLAEPGVFSFRQPVRQLGVMGVMRFLVFGIFLGLTACYADALEQELNVEPFFDLKGYIEKQVDSLNAADLTVTKTIELNGRRESKTVKVDFTNDLRIFREADINRPAWSDKYRVTESREDGQLVRIYEAMDSSLQTRRLSVRTAPNGSPTLIEIERRTGTVLSDGDHRLVYNPASGYRVRTLQVNRFGKNVKADIEVVWP